MSKRVKISAAVGGVVVILLVVLGVILNAQHSHSVAVHKAAVAAAATKHRHDVAAAKAAAKAAAWAVSDNNPTVLATSVQDTFNASWADPTSSSYDPSGTVSSVSCIPDGGSGTGANTQTCILSYSDSYTTNSKMDITVTVAADGQNWISH